MKLRRDFCEVYDGFLRSLVWIFVKLNTDFFEV